MNHPNTGGVMFLVVLHDAGCPAQITQQDRDCHCNPTHVLHHDPDFYTSTMVRSRAQRRAAQRAAAKAVRKAAQANPGKR